jgi:hypothetical protein
MITLGSVSESESEKKLWIRNRIRQKNLSDPQQWAELHLLIGVDRATGRAHLTAHVPVPVLMVLVGWRDYIFS